MSRSSPYLFYLPIPKNKSFNKEWYEQGDTIGNETTFPRARVLIVNEGQVAANEYT